MTSRTTLPVVGALLCALLAFPALAAADAYDDAAKGLVTDHGWTVQAATNAATTLRNMNIPPERSEEFLKAVVWLTPKLAQGHEDDTEAMEGLLKSTMGVLGLGARMWPDLPYQKHAQYILEATVAIEKSCNTSRFETAGLVLKQAEKAKADEIRATNLDGEAFYRAMVTTARQSPDCAAAPAEPVQTDSAAAQTSSAPPPKSVPRSQIRRGLPGLRN